MEAVLKVVEGKQQGAIIPLNTRKFLIGREEDCHLRPNSDLVSRHHCVFTLDDYTVRIRDLGSTNGTFVNEQPATGQVVLKNGDRVRIGKLVFEVLIRSAAPVVQAAPAAPAPETYVQAPPSAEETSADFVIEHSPPQDEDQTGTAILGGDTAFIPPNKPKKREVPVLPVQLPDPETTGAKPVDAPAAQGGGGDAVNPRNSAADIIRQYMQRRPV